MMKFSNWYNNDLRKNKKKTLYKKIRKFDDRNWITMKLESTFFRYTDKYKNIYIRRDHELRENLVEIVLKQKTIFAKKNTKMIWNHCLSYVSSCWINVLWMSIDPIKHLRSSSVALLKHYNMRVY